MHFYDQIAFATYLLFVLVLGLALRGRAGDGNSFFLADRRMGWWSIGISVMVTVFSAVNFAAFPTEVYRYGLYVSASLPVFLLIGIPVTRLVIPFFHRLQPTSAYEFLETRFDRRVRSLASALFIVWRIMWMATALYASSGILASITGLPLSVLIVLTGCCALLYTATGGMRAVIATDIAQFIILFGGIVVALALTVARQAEGWQGLWQHAAANGLLRPYRPFDPRFLSLDPRLRITLWSGLIGTFVAFLARYGADQTVLQRYFTARDLHSAQRGFWWNAVCALAALTLLALLGLAMAAEAERIGASGSGSAPMAQLAALVRSLPPGVCGLLAAGLLAATMSSVDSGIHACTTALYHDFLPARRRDQAGRRAGSARWITVALGITATALAFPVGRLGPLFEVVNRVIHGLGSPLLGVMLLGFFPRRVHSRGVFWGGLAGTVWSIAACFGIRQMALHYYAVVNLLGTLAACYLLSALLPRRG